MKKMARHSTLLVCYASGVGCDALLETASEFQDTVHNKSRGEERKERAKEDGEREMEKRGRRELKPRQRLITSNFLFSCQCVLSYQQRGRREPRDQHCLLSHKLQFSLSGIAITVSTPLGTAIRFSTGKIEMHLTNTSHPIKTTPVDL